MIQSVIQKAPNKEKSGTSWLSEFHQTFREDQERIQILLTTAPWLMLMCLPACPPFLEDEPRVYTAAAPASSRARGEHTGTRAYVALGQWVNEETIFSMGGERIKGVFSLIAAPLLFHKCPDKSKHNHNCTWIILSFPGKITHTQAQPR